MNSTPAAGALPVRFSVVTSASGLLTKTFRLSAEAELVKSVNTEMANGHLEVVSCASPQELATIIGKLRHSQALMCGGPRNGTLSTKLVSRGQRQRGAPGLTRTTEDIDYLDGPGLLFLDFDRLPGNATPTNVRAQLEGVCSAFGGVPIVILPSASSHIVNTAKNEVLRGLTGLHAYVWIERGRDAPEIGARLRDRFVLKGQGWVFISKAGTADVRVPFDASVFQPTRFMYAAGARCEPPIAQQRGNAMVANPEGRPLALSDVPPLSEVERRRVEEIERNLKAQAEPERLRQREAYRAARIAEGVKPEALDRMLESKELEGDFPVQLANGTIVTVAQILEHPDNYHRQACLDPEEPDYYNGKVVGKIFAKNSDGLPRIHSFAHGGRVFTLVQDAEARAQQAQDEFAEAPAQFEGSSSILERLRVSNFAAVEARPVEWLLRGRLARQQITMLNGWPGEGKTSVAIDIVAKLTKGEGLPDGTKPPQPLNVLVCSTEDSQSVLKSRLLVAGADLNRAFTLPDTVLDHLKLPSQQKNWVQLLQDLEIDVLVVDPMMAFLDDDLKSIAEQDARKFAMTLRQVCETANVAALCIRHPNKATAGGHMNAVSASSGSLAFTAAARIELVVGRMPDSEDVRAVAHVKNNLAPAPSALLYRIKQTEVEFTEGTDTVAAVEWVGSDASITAEDLLARRESREVRTQIDEAKEFLQNYLADGPVESRTVRKAAKPRQIKDRTLERALQQVGWSSNIGNLRYGGFAVWGLAGQSKDDYKPEPTSAVNEGGPAKGRKRRNPTGTEVDAKENMSAAGIDLSDLHSGTS